MNPQMNAIKPKRKYTRRYKRGKFAADEPASLQPIVEQVEPEQKRNKHAGLLSSNDWRRTSSGWQPPDKEKTPEQQITRYFKMTRVIEEIAESDLPTVATLTPKVVASLDPPGFKERSEFRVPTLERSETIRL